MTNAPNELFSDNVNHLAAALLAQQQTACTFNNIDNNLLATETQSSSSPTPQIASCCSVASASTSAASSSSSLRLQTIVDNGNYSENPTSPSPTTTTNIGQNSTAPLCCRHAIADQTITGTQADGDSLPSEQLPPPDYEKSLRQQTTIIRKFQKLGAALLSSTPAPDVKIGQRVAYKEYYGNEFGTIRWIGKLLCLDFFLCCLVFRL